jgi:ribosomal protein S19
MKCSGLLYYPTCIYIHIHNHKKYVSSDQLNRKTTNLGFHLTTPDLVSPVEFHGMHLGNALGRPSSAHRTNLNIQVWQRIPKLISTSFCVFSGITFVNFRIKLSRVQCWLEPISRTDLMSCLALSAGLSTTCFWKEKQVRTRQDLDGIRWNSRLEKECLRLQQTRITDRKKIRMLSRHTHISKTF